MIGPLTTQIVGSYVKPAWLLNHARLYQLDGSAWRLSPPFLADAQADLVRLSVAEQERAGLDLLTDGELTRAAYDRYFTARLNGVDAAHLADAAAAPSEISTVVSKKGAGGVAGLPRVVGDISWPGPLSVAEARTLRGLTDRPIKSAVVGPLTAIERLVDEHYGDEHALAMAVAAALNEELLALEPYVDVLQIDEPTFHSRFSRAKRLGVAPLARMVQGLTKPVCVHVCYGYANSKESKSANPDYPEVLELLASCGPITGISLEYEQPNHQPELLASCGDKHVILGLLNLGSHQVETAEHVADRIRAALRVVPPERLHPASDCGMWHLPRDVAYGKICALAAGTRLVRQELGLDAASRA